MAIDGIKLGDVVEIGRPADSIDASISEAIGEQPSIVDCWLVEVTGLGEKTILGFALVGEGSGDKYREVKWKRMDDREMRFSARSWLRRVGRKRGNEFVFDSPELENIYDRSRKCTPSK